MRNICILPEFFRISFTLIFRIIILNFWVCDLHRWVVCLFLWFKKGKKNVPLNLISYSVPFLLLYFIFICLSLLSLLRLFNQMQTLNEGFPAISKQSKAIPLKGEKAVVDCSQTQWGSACTFGRRKGGPN